VGVARSERCLQRVITGIGAITQVVRESEPGKAWPSEPLPALRYGTVRHQRTADRLRAIVESRIDLVNVGDAVELHSMIGHIADLQQRGFRQFLQEIEVPVHDIRSPQVLVHGENIALAAEAALIDSCSAGEDVICPAERGPVDQTAITGDLQEGIDRTLRLLDNPVLIT
jgi:hypothetical protein